MTLFEDVYAAVEAAVEETATPGTAIGLVHDGEEHAAGIGVTSVENPLEVTPETLFQIGSITKTVTGTVAMILVERGELDIDAPVRRYLPKLALADDDVAARVTMRHLLTHTAGWVGDYFADHGAGDDALERMLGDLPRLPQLTPLGEVWSYNNAGFYIAGRVLEVVGGAPYELLVQRLLFEPLGLEHSLFFTEDVMTRRFAVGPPPCRRRSADGGAAVGDRARAPRRRRHLLDGRRPAPVRALPSVGRGGDPDACVARRDAASAHRRGADLRIGRPHLGHRRRHGRPARPPRRRHQRAGRASLVRSRLADRPRRAHERPARGRGRAGGTRSGRRMRSAGGSRSASR